MSYPVQVGDLSHLQSLVRLQDKDAPSSQVYSYVIEDPSSICSVSPHGLPVSNLPPASANFECDGGKMQSGSMWLGVAGLMLVGILMSRSYKGSIIIGAPRLALLLSLCFLPCT